MHLEKLIDTVRDLLEQHEVHNELLVIEVARLIVKREEAAGLKAIDKMTTALQEAV